jgi:tetratricopeptide (TPR) repeat protein
MSKSTVITRKDMKEPDSFQVAAGQAATWLASRKKHVVLAGAGAIAVIIAIAILSTVQSRREEKAGGAASALLSAMGGEVSSTPLPGFSGPVYATDADRQKAVIAEADKLIAQFPGTGPASLAELAKGDAHLRLREWDAAASAYDRYLAGAGSGDSLRFGALEGLALVAEGKGDLAGAAKAYERMAKEAPRFADRADLERARVLAQAGKTAEAKEALAGFSEKHKESLLGPEASERLAKLGGK